jgi:hypothetical protein
MADHAPLRAGPESHPVEGVGPLRSPGQSQAGGAAFEALLEKLEGQAKRIEESSSAIERPEELSEAVGRARESLSDALSLRDRILEAWRANRQAAAGEARED